MGTRKKSQTSGLRCCGIEIHLGDKVCNLFMKSLMTFKLLHCKAINASSTITTKSSDRNSLAKNSSSWKSLINQSVDFYEVRKKNLCDYVKNSLTILDRSTGYSILENWHHIDCPIKGDLADPNKWQPVCLLGTSYKSS